MSEQAEAAAKPLLDNIVEKYVALRDKKAELEAAHKKAKAEFDAALDRIEAYLLKHLNDNGAESIRTAAGTFYKSKQNSATVADWDQVRAWIEQDPETRWPMLEKRVSKLFVEAHLEEHNDLPPGINWRSESVVNVRR